MSRFLDNAASILETAESVPGAGSSENWTILIGPNGGIRMLADNDWPLASLEDHHGASMVYRVSRQGGGVRVEGRAGGRACLLESEAPNRVARRLLADRRQYTLAPKNPSA